MATSAEMNHPISLGTVARVYFRGPGHVRSLQRPNPGQGRQYTLLPNGSFNRVGGLAISFLEARINFDDVTVDQQAAHKRISIRCAVTGHCSGGRRCLDLSFMIVGRRRVWRPAADVVSVLNGSLAYRLSFFPGPASGPSAMAPAHAKRYGSARFADRGIARSAGPANLACARPATPALSCAPPGSALPSRRARLRGFPWTG
jgi:hypothetical protein